MDKIKKILTAIDFSTYSEKTLAYSVNLASQLGAELLIVNVVNQRDINIMDYTITHVTSLGDDMSVNAWIKGVKEDRAKLFEELKKKVDLSGINYKFEFHVGFPFEELMRTIKVEKADMIVMGAKGRENLADFLVGAVANKMFRKCPVPLVSVRAGEA